MRIAWVWFVLVTFVALAPVHPALAKSAVPVLVLPTQLGGVVPDRAGWQREFDARLEHAINRAGRAPRPSGPLPATDSTCREAECMARIAEAADVNIVLGLRVTADRGSPPSYKLAMTRYDRDRPGVVRQEDAECTVCTEIETAERIEHMVSVMLPSLVVVPPRVDTVARPAPNKGPSRQALLALMGVSATLGVVGIAMLGVGGRALAIDGGPSMDVVPPARQAPEVYDTRGAGTGFVVVGAILLVSSVVELGLEGWALRKRSR